MSGFMTARSGRTLAFSMFANDMPGDANATAAMDAALLMVAELTPEIQRTILEDLAGESERLNRMVENLLVLARVERGVTFSGQEPVLLQRLLPRIVAEEARHISFAHEYIRRRGPRMGRLNRLVSSIAFPIIMRAGCDLLMVPPRSFRKEFGIPRKVMKDLYWRAPESRERLQELFADVRMLAEQSGLMNPVARWVWRLLKIDGRSSRYRSEPPATFAA